MPVGPYKTFADCVAAQKKKGKSQESAGAICGAIEKRMKKEQELAQAKLEMAKHQALTAEMIFRYAELSSKARKKLPSSAFVYPKEKRYPIHDLAHARNALARVAQHGTPAEKAKVKSAVCKKYPQIASCKEGKKKTEEDVDDEYDDKPDEDEEECETEDGKKKKKC